MAKFRKKPVVIEAVQWLGPPTLQAIIALAGQQKIYRENHQLVIPTLEGDMRADPGDWIIQGVQGEIYPCKPEIFDITYDLESD